MNENAVIREILSCFAYHKFYVLPPIVRIFPYIDPKANRGWVGRRNTGAGHLGSGHGRFVRFNAPGTSDIEGIVFGTPAVPISVEAKAPGGKLSESQGNYLKTLLDGGGFGLIARSYEEVHKWFKLLKFCERDTCK